MTIFGNPHRPDQALVLSASPERLIFFLWSDFKFQNDCGSHVKSICSPPPYKKFWIILTLHRKETIAIFGTNKYGSHDIFLKIPRHNLLTWAVIAQDTREHWGSQSGGGNWCELADEEETWHRQHEGLWWRVGDLNWRGREWTGEGREWASSELADEMGEGVAINLGGAS